jgi:glycosyltransferase involved in cell wall biosynthesis
VTPSVAPIRPRILGARPRVCVALPVRDGADFLALALDSVLRQEGVDLEVRVLDNGSADASPTLARAYADADPRVVVDVNPFDLTYYGSLNRALAETDADYFVPFAADDVMYPGNLLAKVTALEETGAALASSSADLIAADGAPLDGLCPDHRETPTLTPSPQFFRRLVPQNAISCQSVVVRTDALRAIGGFDARSFYAADWLAWMRLSLRHTVVTLPDALIANRVHAHTITQTGNAAGFNARDVPATLAHVFEDERLPPEWQGLYATVVAASYCLTSTALQDAGMLRVAHGWAAYLTMLRALATAPADEAIRKQTLRSIQGAGLHPIDLPCELVAMVPATEQDTLALAAALRELGPLAGPLLLALPADSPEGALARLEPVLGAIDLDVVLVADTTVAKLLRPGRMALVPWGSDLAGVAEATGVPVYSYDVPDPFAAPADPDRWQALAVERRAA